MKILWPVLFFIVLCWGNFAIANPAPCQPGDLKVAADYVAATTKNFNDGIVSKVDLLVARSAQLDVQLCAGDIAAADFCAKKQSLLGEILKVLQGPSWGNYRSNFGMVDYIGKMVEFRKACNSEVFNFSEEG